MNARAHLGLAVLIASVPLDALGADLALTRGSLESGGVQRTFAYHLPSKEKGGRLPLVISLHGRMGQGEPQERLSHFSTVGEREGFIVVSPDGIRRSWADARGKSPASKEGIDDVRFISDLIDFFVRDHGADPSRVFATGMSNGALMSHTLGCRLADRIAAIGPVAGTMPSALGSDCHPSRPVSVILFLGTKDPLVPYGGGVIQSGAGGGVLSAAETLRTWATLDGCTGKPETAAEPDGDPSDGTTVKRERFGSCRDGSVVVLYTVENGGHTWPGGWQYAPEFMIGKTTRDIDASEAIWNFFKSLPPRAQAKDPAKPTR